ncbi:MAG: hypothetical protein ACXIU8_10880 [Alkalilacustris sp.]
MPALAKALESDPRLMFKLALEQDLGSTSAQTVEDIFGTIVTRNEVAWLEALREASDHGDPTLTSRAKTALRGIFGK